MSDRYTFGFDPSLLFRIEKNPCSPDAKCVLWERHMAQSSLLAHAPVNKSTPSPSESCTIRERIGPPPVLLQFRCRSEPHLTSLEGREASPHPPLLEELDLLACPGSHSITLLEDHPPADRHLTPDNAEANPIPAAPATIARSP